MTFQPGQSGNPAGRPRGARGKATIFAERLFEGEAEAIIRTAIDLAKGGDMTAVRVCMDRIAPRQRERAIAYELPPLHSAADAASAVGEIVASVAAGDLTPAEAGELIKLIQCFLMTLSATAFEERIERLERRFGVGEHKRGPNGGAAPPITQ